MRKISLNYFLQPNPNIFVRSRNQRISTGEYQKKFFQFVTRLWVFFQELLPVFLSYFPAGISIKTLEHYAQLIANGGRFQMFDYGPQINLKQYNSTIPPEYDVKRISVPVHLFVGSEDIIADQQVFFCIL